MKLSSPNPIIAGIFNSSHLIDICELTPPNLVIRPFIPFEKIRLRGKGSDGGHNGLKDIQTVLGSTVYPRLRVGIGDQFTIGKQINYVLGEWTKEEGLLLQEISVRSQKAVESFCAIGLERSMNTFNTDK